MLKILILEKNFSLLFGEIKLKEKKLFANFKEPIHGNFTCSLEMSRPQEKISRVNKIGTSPKQTEDLETSRLKYLTVHLSSNGWISFLHQFRVVLDPSTRPPLFYPYKFPGTTTAFI